MVRAAAVLAIVLGLAAAPAAAQVQAPAKPQTTSLDSDAPPGAPPHWLPGEPWVMQHWLPYDERRLYRCSASTAASSGAGCATTRAPSPSSRRQRGWEPEALARELVAPWRGRAARARSGSPCSRSARCARSRRATSRSTCSSTRCTRRRSPRHAPAIFGVASRVEWSTPAALASSARCRSAGSTASRAATRSGRRTATLRADRRLGRRAPGDPAPRRPSACSPASCASSRAGCSRRATTARRRSSARASRRRRRPTTPTTPRSPVTAGALVFERLRGQAGDRQDAGRDRGDGPRRPAPAGAAAREPLRRLPALELQPGDVRGRALGRVRVRARQPELRQALRADGGATSATCAAAARSGPPATRRARPRARRTTRRSRATAASIAYETYERPERSAVAHRRRRARHAQRRAERACPRRRRGPATLYEPRLSADGRRLAFSVARRAAAGERSEVFVQRPATGRVRRVSRAGEEAWEPVLSARGAVVAYTAAGPGGELARGRPRPATRRHDGDRLAGRHRARLRAVAVGGRRSRGVRRAARRRCASTQVFVRDVARRSRRSSSRAPTAATGRPGRAPRATRRSPATAPRSRSPPMPGTCRRTSATAPAACSCATCARAHAAGERGDGDNRYIGPTKGSSTGGDAFVMLLCA